MSGTPFFPQKRYQCGPAALATALGASGVDVTPDDLVADVYLPGRHGSLQAELIAATRRYQRVATQIEPDLEGLVQELRAGHPPLLLLNLGFSWLPVWHYAVVVGYEPQSSSFILRSGTRKRARMSAAELMRSWAYSDRWAVIVSGLQTPPATATAVQWLTAVAPYESLGKLDDAERGYRAATMRWPDSALAWTALGNIDARRAEWIAAIAAYNRALELGDDIVTLNNRASALGSLQCRRLALGDLDRAAALDVDRRYAAALGDTRTELPPLDHCSADSVDRLAESAP
nr:PA2778 family cysteine peptidase [Solimonas terrae]